MKCIGIKHNGEYRYMAFKTNEFYPNHRFTDTFRKICYRDYEPLSRAGFLIENNCEPTTFKYFADDPIYTYYEGSRMFLATEFSQHRFYNRFSLVPKVKSLSEFIQCCITNDW